ncbi:MAG: dTDP-4-dehydrorhamnose 3,5-epimerase [Candidatus Yanofskybacteria bacterium]|nr:dTDP-4-dehydrorhamnose 3,5-epimerase [Candidatus Yanofskybacteria bacterium]
MKFISTPFPGLYIVELEKNGDPRGFFARAYDAQEFKKLNLKDRFVQTNVSRSRERGTLRGLHYQTPPYAEAKLIRCTKGALYDVALDLRPDSPTYKQWFGVELTEDNQKQLYIPEGLAHGFITLKEDTEAFYMVSECYHPEAEKGVRHDDPAFKIKWPIPIEVISDKDKSWPSFQS